MNLPDSFSDEKLEIHDGVKLYRTAADLVRRLDAIGKHVSTCEDLFATEAKVLRTRLREQCERLMFYDPVGHGKKAEELLWRKVYYDVITTGKQLRKDENALPEAALSEHLYSGSGTYHHLLFRIQTEYDIQVGTADFLYPSSNRFSKNEKGEFHNKKISAKRKEWALNAYHRCLVYLGDLARYRHELFRNYGAEIASRYYAQAAAFLPQLGMPHNQQGTLTGSTNYGCDAAYHYMRCLSSGQSFDGSKGNLERIFEKASRILTNLEANTENESLHREISIKRCLAKFLKFCEFCCTEERSNTSVQLEYLCQDILQDFYTCIHFTPKENETSNESSESGEIVVSLDHGLIFKLIAMALMATHLLNNKDSSSQSAAIAFSLALFSHLLQYTLLRLQRALGLVSDTGNNLRVEEETNEANSCCAKDKRNAGKNTRGYQTRRRRKRFERSVDSDLSEGERKSDEDSDLEWTQTSDMSEAENEDSDKTSSDSDGSNGSDNGNCLKLMINGTTRNKNKSDTSINCHKGGKNCKNVNYALKCAMAVSELDDLLMAIKVCTDWLRTHPAIFTVCAPGCQLLWNRLITLLNLVSPVLSCDVKDGVSNPELLTGLGLCRGGKSWPQPCPLPEDVALSGFPLLSDAHENLSCETIHRVWLSSLETSILRVACIYQFGLNLVESDVTDLVFDSKQGVFKKIDDQSPWPHANREQKNEVEIQRKKVMENMAHLWLKAEVTELECRVQSGSVPHLSPYLVVTTPVLTHHLPALRQLVASKRFIVVIPSVVICHLDWMKKDSLQAREVIRWLETEFRRGNRYLRAQKPHEQMSLSPIKYPRRKDKDAWNLFKVLELCKHLSEQKAQSASSGLVTLLTGNQSQSTSGVNLRALADSTGVSTECIDDFLHKWINSANKNGSN